MRKLHLYVYVFTYMYICVIYVCVYLGVFMCIYIYTKIPKGSSLPFRTTEGPVPCVLDLSPVCCDRAPVCISAPVSKMEAAWPVFFPPCGKRSRSTHTASASPVENWLPGICWLLLSGPRAQRITSGAAFPEWQFCYWSARFSGAGRALVWF